MKLKIFIPPIFKKGWFLFLLVILLIFSGYFYWQRQQKTRKGVETYQITRKDLQQTVTASGKITAENQVTLRFQATGFLNWVGVKKGDPVKQWQAIASINQKELEKSLKKELLDYMNERWDLEQTRANYQDKSYDAATLETIRRTKDKAQFDLDSTVLDVEIADIAKKFAVLVTPIAGIVTEATDEQPGVNISLLNTKYVIVDPDSLRFTAEVEELDINLIQKGLPATLDLDAFPDKPLSTQVDTIDFTATETVSGSTAYNVYLPLPVGNDYRLDMNGNVSIIVDQKNNVLAIPIQAVIVTQDKKEVTVLKDKKKEKREIKTGLETEDYYEVTEGLNEGEIIVFPK